MSFFNLYIIVANCLVLRVSKLSHPTSSSTYMAYIREYPPFPPLYCILDTNAAQIKIPSTDLGRFTQLSTTATQAMIKTLRVGYLNEAV